MTKKEIAGKVSMLAVIGTLALSGIQVFASETSKEPQPAKSQLNADKKA